ASLARAHFQNADYDQASNQFTQDGLKELSAAAVAWNHYLQLKPPKPDDQTANLMVQAFSDVGLKKPDKAVEAMEVVLAGRKPTAGLYGNYAILAYTAGQSRKGDLAVKKAVELAPKANKKSLKAQLDAAKSQALVQSAQSQQAPAVSGG
ncbi:MAG: hypothetical protein QOE31_2587, partial [Solirubrobacteraceae bacterium]|nr:hypothetical protein [Solirubrobacteraceae bacterium]